MKTLLLSSFVLISLIGMSQITVTDADFAVGGDTARVSFSDETTLDLVTTGADVIWDFSSINITTQAIDTFHDVSDADWTYQLVFNNGFTEPDHESDWFTPWFGGGLGGAGQFGLDAGGFEQFTAVESNEVKVTGFGFEVFGTGIPAPSDTIDVKYELPMNYQDAWTSNAYTNVDLNPAFDAIYRSYQWRDSEVDGWGEVITPFGTFDALRIRSEVTSVDSLYIGQFSFWVELPTPDQVEYHWFTNGQKLPIFSVTTTDVGGNETITEIKFKDKKRDFASNEEYNLGFEVYPNPAEDQLNIQLKNEASLIQIFDMTGKLIYSEIPTSNLLQMNVQDWDAGMYILEISQSSGIFTRKISVQ